MYSENQLHALIDSVEKEFHEVRYANELAENISQLQAVDSRFIGMSQDGVIGFLLGKVSALEHEINELKNRIPEPKREESHTTGSSYVLKI